MTLEFLQSTIEFVEWWAVHCGISAMIGGWIGHLYARIYQYKDEVKFLKEDIAELKETTPYPNSGLEHHVE